MLSKIEALIEELKWEIKDREINYVPAGDLENIMRKLEAIVSSERENNVELN